MWYQRGTWRTGDLTEPTVDIDAINVEVPGSGRLTTMPHERSLTERRAEIDSRLETALDAADSGQLAPVWTTILERDDRLYGQLVALSHNTLAATPDQPVVVPAATAIELLRGYVRLREQLILRLGNQATDSLKWEVTTALLASDYLYTAAYSTLGARSDDHIAECFEEFTTVSESVIEAVGRNSMQSTLSSDEYCSIIDDTVGALGRGAAVIGATLADVDDLDRDHFATVGRGFGTARQIQLLLASDSASRQTSSPLPVRQLRQHAKQRLQETNHALQQLSSAADVGSLRAFVAETVTESTADSVVSW